MEGLSQRDLEAIEQAVRRRRAPAIARVPPPPGGGVRSQIDELLNTAIEVQRHQTALLVNHEERLRRIEAVPMFQRRGTAL